MTPLTIELAGRRLPCLRYADRDHMPPATWSVLHAAWRWTAQVPAGESARVIEVAVGSTYIVVCLGDRSVMEDWWMTGVVYDTDLIAECRVLTEDEALAQIVEWSRPAGVVA